MLKKFTFLVFFLFSAALAADCVIDSKMTLIDCYQLCRVLYNGSRNYFNKTTGLCDVVRQCSDSEQYDYLSNSCAVIDQDTSDFPSFNNTAAGGSASTPGKVSLVNFSVTF
jgi:hypothetical protein